MALAYAADSTEVLMGAELLVAIGDRLDRIGLNSEGTALLKCFIRLLPAEERVLRSRLWTAIARTARTDRAQALEASSTAISLARNASDDAALADALVVYATSLVHVRRFEDSAAALTEATALASADNVWLHLRIAFTRAYLNLVTGDLDAAAAVYERLREVNQQLGNATQANGIAITLAELQHQRGETAAAVALAQEVLGAFRADRDRRIARGCACESLRLPRRARSIVGGASGCARSVPQQFRPRSQRHLCNGRSRACRARRRAWQRPSVQR